jgi:cyclase
VKRSHGAWMVATVALASSVAFGQGQSYHPLGIDFSGYWSQLGRHQDAGLGTAAGELIDYGGVPVSEAGRLYALAWSASRLTLPQHQCVGYVAPYVFVAPGYFRFWEERESYTQDLLAVKMRPYAAMPDRTIWMDGRPHPPAYAQHTWAGFSTGTYEGNILAVYTTHIKRGQIRANGLAQSDQAALEEHFIRHGDRITYFSVLTDPVYLDEPLAKTSALVHIANDPNSWTMPCDDGDVILGKANDQVDNYLWGQHPFLQGFSEKHNVPLLGALGGPATVYPDFMAKLKDPAAADAAAQAESAPAPGPPHASRAVDPDPHDGEIHILPVQGNVYMLVGDGGNIAVQVGKDEGAMVVDSGAGRLSDKVIAAIRTLSDKPIQFIVNTSFHLDHTGGNARLHAVGYDPEANGGILRVFADAGMGATMMAHQNVLNRMSAPTGKVAPTPADGWPTDTYVQGRRRKLHNGEAVELFWEPNATTDGDSIVHFRRSDVIVTGDIFNSTRYPVIDVKAGGTVQGEITALNNILDKTVSWRQEGGTLVIPGHGRLCNEWEVTEYRDTMVIIRDRVQAMIGKGATLQQVLAARVSADYDARFGSNSGPWTTAMFIEAVYTSLKDPAVKTAVRK